MSNVLSKATIVISGTIVQSRIGQFTTMLKLIEKEIFKCIENYKITEKEITSDGVIPDLLRAILGSLALRESSCLKDGQMPEVDEFLMFSKCLRNQKHFIRK